MLLDPADPVLAHAVEFGDPRARLRHEVRRPARWQSVGQWWAMFSLALTVVVGKVVAWQAGPGGLDYRSVP